MLDIKLYKNGDYQSDLDITEDGDIQLDDNPLQDAKTALLWIAGEWRLGPDAGLPWFDEILIKNASTDIISQELRNALLEVDGIDDADVQMLEMDQRNRTIRFVYTITSGTETYSEEVEVGG